MEAIRYYVKGAFLGIDETPEVLEQQEEIIADLSAKFEDLVTEGRTEEEALGVAIASMGDLSDLVREFATNEGESVSGSVAPVAEVVDAYTGKLYLHSVILSVIIALGVLLVGFFFAVTTASITEASTGLWGLFVGAAGVAWMGYALWRFHQDSDEIDVVELSRARLWRALKQWAAVCAGAFLLNIAFDGEFWSWTIWIGAAAWPASFFVEQWLLLSGRFLYPKSDAAAEQSCEDACPNGSCA